MSQEAAQFLFVSHRKINIGSTQGHSIQFEKGVPTHVPRGMHTAVMEKGCVPCDGKGQALDAPASTAIAEAAEPAGAKLAAPEDAEERAEAIRGVIEKLFKRNNARDFSAGGVPSSDAVTFELGWRVDPREILPIWKKQKPKLIGSSLE